ncbi:D-Ala-D-Ala carboxypeptidase family metallohydrolase [Marinobacterium sedimentorum]|uniref:D-Ala-D-Ala carboxypeptidase family metallohydrolase n=1 Tax=Marinobacterium sedimentorum TaxID=2927804 RepID=UPI0020C5FEE3|nr:D-Ala-D-Ala carboxypeptidase family metallohydrolase [Marinobacterium sedimentorum]MCP8687131.1 D-Ala-D-Ala carboxypeptidase family metallohydrolase [Marinobacterium sedimentorum]
MANQWNYAKLEGLGRTRLSENFFMREFLHSEIAQAHGLTNAPENPELAIEAGKQLCEQVLEPIQAAWGKVHIRSGYRSPEVNALGNSAKMNCASNESNRAAHIWDALDASGQMGATACIVIPAWLDQFEKTGDWASLAWWIHHQVPGYYEMVFFKNLCAFNIRWYQGNDGNRTIRSFLPNPDTGDKSALISKGQIHPYYASMSEPQRFAAAQAMIDALIRG